jgi:GTP-binding protein YchF
MKLGLTGLQGSGRATIFTALTGTGAKEESPGVSKTDSKVSTISVPDDRIDFLKRIYQPKKTIFAKIEYLLPSDISGASASTSDGGTWSQLRACDALLQVVRNFQIPGGPAPNPEQDFQDLQEEMILSDLAVTEKRIEKIDLDRKKGKKPEEKEYDLLKNCKEHLEKGEPLRKTHQLATEPLLRGFTFLSAKPILVIMNNEDEDQTLPKWGQMPGELEFLVVRGRLEMDIASMSEEEASEFRDAYNIEESALNRVIRKSYDLLDLISFFTVLSDEVRAWPIKAGSSALIAAGTVHTDMQKGFIRAEVLSLEDLQRCGSVQEAKKAGLIRLEGKEYMVKDGDIINFRFNV